MWSWVNKNQHKGDGTKYTQCWKWGKEATRKTTQVKRYWKTALKAVFTLDHAVTSEPSVWNLYQQNNWRSTLTFTVDIEGCSSLCWCMTKKFMKHTSEYNWKRWCGSSRPDLLVYISQSGKTFFPFCSPLCLRLFQELVMFFKLLFWWRGLGQGTFRISI